MTTKKITIALDLDEVTVNLLATLGEPKQVLMQLIDHAAQGVYRPGAWERPWLAQAFGDEFLSKLEPGDPWDRPGPASYFNRPRRPAR